MSGLALYCELVAVPMGLSVPVKGRRFRQLQSTVRSIFSVGVILFPFQAFQVVESSGRPPTKGRR